MAIANIVLHDLDLSFQGQTCEARSVRASVKVYNYFYRGWYSHRMAIVWMFYSTALTYIFFSRTNVSNDISETVKAIGKPCNNFYRFWLLTWNGTIVHRFCAASLWPSFLRQAFSCICNTNCSVTVDVPGRFASTRMASFMSFFCFKQPTLTSCFQQIEHSI